MSSSNRKLACDTTLTDNKNAFAQEDLCYLPVKELLTLFKAQKISPVDLLKAQIAQIEKYNATINAHTAMHFEEAYIQAHESEKRYKEGTQRPLEGITCAIKDEVDVKGWRTTKGSKIHANDPVSEEDAALITLLRNAGVVMHVQTNIPEYYCNLVTHNLDGICRNPWNLKYTPGGSSGGSAAALAAGFTTLAVGSDMGGSIRSPASMVGIYGFKPPFGRIASSDVQFESEGPMARTIEDLIVFQNAIAGPTPEMMSAIYPKLDYPLEYKPIDGLRIAYDPMKNWGVPIDQSVINAMEHAVTILKANNVEVVEVDLGFRADHFETYARGIFATSIGPYCFDGPISHPELITPNMARLTNKYKNATPHDLTNIEDLRTLLNKRVQTTVFANPHQTFHVIIMPTLCSPYIDADMGTTDQNNSLMINGKLHSADTWNYAFTWHWNILYNYPVVNVPIGKTREDIPIGMQIIGNTLRDLDAFQVAAAWSKMSAIRFFDKTNRPALDKIKSNGTEMSVNGYVKR